VGELGSVLPGPKREPHVEYLKRPKGVPQNGSQSWHQLRGRPADGGVNVPRCADLGTEPGPYHGGQLPIVLPGEAS